MKNRLLERILKRFDLTKEVKVEYRDIEDIARVMEAVPRKKSYHKETDPGYFEEYASLDLWFELKDKSRVYKIFSLGNCSSSDSYERQLNYDDEELSKYNDISKGDSVLLTYRQYEEVKYDYKDNNFDEKVEVKRINLSHSSSFLSYKIINNKESLQKYLELKNKI